MLLAGGACSSGVSAWTRAAVCHHPCQPIQSADDQREQLSDGFVAWRSRLLAAVVGLGLLLGALVCWSWFVGPQYRLRSCFLVSLIFAVLFTCQPLAVRVARHYGVEVTTEGITMSSRKTLGRGPSSPSHIIMRLPFNPRWLALVLIPTFSGIFLISRVYRGLAGTTPTSLAYLRTENTRLAEVLESLRNMVEVAGAQRAEVTA